MKIWLGGRKFKLERRLNKSGRFLFCPIVAEGAKRSSLIFLEGRDLHRGWFVLAEKLCHLGVVPSTEVRKVVSLAKVRSTPRELTEDGTFADAVRKDLGVVRESVWLQLGESEVQFREEQLSQYLVWWFGKVSVPLPKLTSVEKLVTNLWSFAKGEGVKISGFRVALLLFYFEVSFEAELVLARGSRRLRERVLHLMRWTPEVGCLRQGGGLLCKCG
ncbi:uncharacterized protein LOC117906349 [Vitis riparia]|uniref:uncharacterized protein LOC117906349 n=1 Tax=Vitis riparia TaxID=96939 RepID=UPI00155A8049|nr:uncharacterized protein LOC117906349 [Vitis riparia]